MSRIINVLVALDQTANAVLGGRFDETISGTIGRALAAGRRWARIARFLVDGVFGQGHCARQARYEAAVRASKPPFSNFKLTG